MILDLGLPAHSVDFYRRVLEEEPDDVQSYLHPLAPYYHCISVIHRDNLRLFICLKA